MKAIEELAAEVRSNRIGDFAQYCRALMISKGQPGDLPKGSVNPRVAELIQKATIPPGGGSGTWGEQLAGARLVLGAFSDSLRFSSAFAAAMNAGLIVKVPLGDSIGLVMAGASDASEVGRGDAIPVHMLAVNNTNVPRRKAAGLVVLTNEFLRQSPREAESVITRELRAAVGAAIDAAVVADLTAGVTPHSTLANPLRDARVLLEDVAITPMSRPFWIAGSIAAVRMATFYDGGRADPELGVLGGTFLGLPLFVTAAAAVAETLVLVDGARVAGNLVVEVSYSSQALVESTDAPTGGIGSGSPATLTALGTTALVSLWQEDAAGIKALQYFGLVRLRSSAVASVFLGGSP